MVNTKMRCTICGHIYDPKKGDEGITAGTAFSEIPKDWCCPICGAEKSKFVEI